MIKTVCNFLSKHLPSSTIAKDNVKYLTRYYLLLKDFKYFNVYLHHFHSSDLDLGKDNYGLLHNHPFAWSFGFPLINGYLEERRSQNKVVSKFVSPFTFNFMTHDDFHRVDLIQNEAWTIFITGPRIKDWCFWDRQTKEYINWKSIPGAIE